MKNPGKLRLFEHRLLAHITIAFVDENTVGKLYYALFYALQFVALGRKLYKKKEISH